MKTLATALLFVCSALAQNWPQFRGPQASGVAEKADIPVQFDVAKGTNVRWKTPIPGVAVSSPIVWGDHVFVTTAVSSDTSASLRTGLYGDVEPAKDTSKHSWEVYALDRRSGKVLWKRVAHEGLPKTKRHPKSSQASPTPVTDGKVVVAHFGSEGLYAYDFNGNLLWKQDVGRLNAGWFFDPDYEWGVASSPILFRDMVIIQADIQKDSFVAAYRLKDGRQVWKTMRDEIPSWGTPAIYEDKQRPELITHATKFIRGYDPLTGRELWRLSGNSEITTPTPLIAHGLIYVTNGYRGIQPIYAIRPGASGDITLPKGEESSEFIAWSKPRGGPYTPTPLIYGDLMYILSNNGVLAAYNAKTGERLYQERVGKGGSYSASPVAANGRLYLTSEDGEINVVKTGPKFELIGENSVGEVTMATPAIAGDLMIIRGLKHVIAIGGTPRASR
jgi:outer membrane protein assembly factor BamB